MRWIDPFTGMQEPRQTKRNKEDPCHGSHILDRSGEATHLLHLKRLLNLLFTRLGEIPDLMMLFHKTFDDGHAIKHVENLFIEIDRLPTMRCAQFTDLF